MRQIDRKIIRQIDRKAIGQKDRQTIRQIDINIKCWIQSLAKSIGHAVFGIEFYSFLCARKLFLIWDIVLYAENKINNILFKHLVGVGFFFNTTFNVKSLETESIFKTKYFSVFFLPCKMYYSFKKKHFILNSQNVRLAIFIRVKLIFEQYKSVWEYEFNVFTNFKGLNGRFLLVLKDF